MSERLCSPFAIAIAEPHGFCSGVRRAVEVAERALDEAASRGERLYCFHELVHNRLVVERLSSRGMVFVDDLADVPDGAAVVFSAHGVSPAIRAAAAARAIRTVDATCVFVEKVHENVRRFSDAGYTVLLAGSSRHDETVGTAGEAPQSVVVVESEADVAAATVPDPEKVAFLTQTTLGVAALKPIADAVRRRFPHVAVPSRAGVCFATDERQAAVASLAAKVDLVIVLGSPTSANSNRLVDVARAAGTRAALLQDAAGVADFARGGGLAGVAHVGVTAGASTPEDAVSEAVALLERLSQTGRL